MPCRQINTHKGFDVESHKPLFDSFFPYSKERLGYTKPFSLNFLSDQENHKLPLGKTAHYNPSTYEISVYTDGRHIKDILRSVSHELVHHTQNCRGDLSKELNTSLGYAQEDGDLREMEKEAYLEGNMLFRDWEDNYKQGPNTIQETKKMTGKKELIVLIREELKSTLSEKAWWQPGSAAARAARLFGEKPDPGLKLDPGRLGRGIGRDRGPDAITAAELAGGPEVAPEPELTAKPVTRRKPKGPNMKLAILQAKLNLALQGAQQAGKKVTRSKIPVDGVPGPKTRQAIKDINRAAELGGSSRATANTNHAIHMFGLKVNKNPHQHAVKAVMGAFAGKQLTAIDKMVDTPTDVASGPPDLYRDTSAKSKTRHGGGLPSRRGTGGGEYKPLDAPQTRLRRDPMKESKAYKNLRKMIIQELKRQKQ